MVSCSSLSEFVYHVDRTNKEGRHTTTTAARHSKTYTSAFMVKMVQGCSLVAMILQWMPKKNAVVFLSML